MRKNETLSPSNSWSEPPHSPCWLTRSRALTESLAIPVTTESAAMRRTLVDNNASDGVAWVHSYVTGDKLKTCCIYDAPSPKAIQRSARINNLPVDSITEARVLDQYFNRWQRHRQSQEGSRRSARKGRRSSNSGCSRRRVKTA
ncbi:MAG TPA: DUF4242 domain-containing protein [Ktedonobacterales bacterium]